MLLLHIFSDGLIPGPLGFGRTPRKPGQERPRRLL